MSNHTKLLAICLQTGLPNGKGRVPTNVPCLLVGMPGIAKTAVLSKMAAALSKKLGKPFPCETIACPQVQPETIGGLPVPNMEKQQTELFIYKAGKILKEVGQGVLFFDEFSSAPDPVAAACLTAIQSAQLGDFYMPQSVARVAAMNDPARAVAGRTLMAPESNRFCFIPWDIEFDDYENYIRGGEGALRDVVILPDGWEEDYFGEASSKVLAFLRAFPKHFKNEPDPSDACKAWPSPRSWENAMRLVAACLSLGEKLTSTLVQEAIEGCVGDAAGAEFNTWINMLDIPDPEEVLKQGVNYKFKTNIRDDQLAAALESLAEAAVRKNPSRLKRCMVAADIIMLFEKKKDIIMQAITTVCNRGLRQEGNTITHPIAKLWLQLNKEVGLLSR